MALDLGEPYCVGPLLPEWPPLLVFLPYLGVFLSPLTSVVVGRTQVLVRLFEVLFTTAGGKLAGTIVGIRLHV